MRPKLVGLVGALLLVQILVSSIAFAQQGGGYDFSWSTLGGGGGAANGGSFDLAGTIGQPGVEISTAGSYQLSSGFWSGPGEPASAPSTPTPPGNESHRLYLPLVIK